MRKSRAPVTVAPHSGTKAAGPKSGAHSGRASFSARPSYSPARMSLRARPVRARWPRPRTGRRGPPAPRRHGGANSRAQATQSSMVTPDTGTNGHTSRAPRRGCSPRCRRMSIRCRATRAAASAPSTTAAFVPTNVYTVRFVDFAGVHVEERAAGSGRMTAAMASMTAPIPPLREVRARTRRSRASAEDCSAKAGRPPRRRDRPLPPCPHMKRSIQAVGCRLAIASSPRSRSRLGQDRRPPDPRRPPDHQDGGGSGDLARTAGSWPMAFARRTWRQDAYVTRLWLAPTDGGAAFPLTTPGKNVGRLPLVARRPLPGLPERTRGRQGPDLRHLPWRAGRRCGSRSRRPAISEFAWSRDGRQIVFVADEPESPGHEGPQGEVRRLRGGAARVRLPPPLHLSSGGGPRGARGRPAAHEGTRVERPGSGLLPRREDACFQRHPQPRPRGRRHRGRLRAEPGGRLGPARRVAAGAG